MTELNSTNKVAFCSALDVSCSVSSSLSYKSVIVLPQNTYNFVIEVVFFETWIYNKNVIGNTKTPIKV